MQRLSLVPGLRARLMLAMLLTSLLVLAMAGAGIVLSMQQNPGQELAVLAVLGILAAATLIGLFFAFFLSSWVIGSLAHALAQEPSARSEIRKQPVTPESADTEAQLGASPGSSADASQPALQHAIHLQLPELMRRKRILIVSAEPWLAFTLGQMLDAMEVLAGSATSGSEALVTLQTAAECGRAFDLVLCAWNLPDIQGLELCRQLLDLPLTSRPAVIMLAHPRDRASVPGGFEPGPEQSAPSAILDLPVLPSILAETLQALWAPDASRADPAADANAAPADDAVISNAPEKVEPAASNRAYCDELRAALQALAPEIRAHRITRCQGRLESLDTLTWPESLRDDFQELGCQLKRYRFAAAGETLERLLEKLSEC